jgi:HAD superfamily phosphoserine phosphatase-like hydrolase
MEEIKLICFDLNKTLIRENTWYELNLALGMTPEEDEHMLRDYEAGKISYEEWGRQILHILKSRGKATRQNIEKTVMHYTLLPGAREIIEYLHSKKYTTALITGSTDILAKAVAQDLGIQHYRAHHEFIFDKNDYLDRFTILGDEQHTKVKQLQEICKERDFEITQCAAVGDGDNDKELFKATHHGITFTGSKIENDAWKVIPSLLGLKEVV